MNKKEFIKKEIEKNKERFGRWHSTRLRGKPSEHKLMFEPAPKNKEEALQHCNALFATGRYPIVTDGCFNVGISGGCGLECFVYQNGECGEPEEMTSGMTAKELKDHQRLYPKEQK